MKTILKWIFGILSFLIGLISISISVTAGILFLVAAAFLIPPIFDRVNYKGQIRRPLKIIIPIGAIFVGFIVGGIANSKEVNTAMKAIEEKQKEVLEKEKIERKVQNNQTYDDSRNTISNSKEIIWSNELSKNDILGNWILIQYYENQDSSEITTLKNNDPEQKQLTFTDKKYQTSYPNGTGENNPWNYNLSKNYLSVQTSNTKQEIYGFIIKLSEDKNKLLLKENSGLVQIFQKI